MSFIYLASPYSHPSADVRESRWRAARQTTIYYLRRGQPIFSPIVYGRDMEAHLGTDFKSWQPLNDAMVRVCWEVRVLCLPGWENSKGVAHEIRLANSLRKPVSYISFPME
jgi:hypothetical protein